MCAIRKGDFMKGIILAGGSGTRLYPLTSVISKQLLPVYDKPMICYPLSTLMLLGITEILIISTPQDTPLIEGYLGNGHHLGIEISYKVQDAPSGIAEAFLIGEAFIADEDVCLILGDNIFHIGEKIHDIKERIKDLDETLVFGYHVTDPERFGVIEFEKGSDTVLSIEEKPAQPKSNYAAVGLYCYPSDVVEKTKKLKPSDRGELEISDLNNVYLQDGKLQAIRLPRGTAWLDAGTPDSLLDAAVFASAIERRQGLKIGCPEEAAYRMGYIDEKGLESLISQVKDGVVYKTYLENIFKE
jgi:glucose-1-phosphate thymidylyltransferase